MVAPVVLRAAQIAELLDVTERTVRRWIADGTLPSVKLGGARLVTQATLQQRLSTPLDLPEKDSDEEV